MAGDPCAHCSEAESRLHLPKITAVYWDSAGELEVHFDRELAGIGEPARYSLDPAVPVLAAQPQASGSVALLTTETLDIQAGYTLTFAADEGPLTAGLYPRRVLDAFASDAPLGSGIDESGNTWFAVFAPRARAVMLHTAAGPDTAEEGDPLPLERDAATGIWRTTLPGNRHGLYYWYTVDGPRAPGERFDPTRPLNDPYSYVALSSAGGVAGRSMVFDLARLEPATRLADRPPIEGLVAYELHVRDLTGGPGSGVAADDPAFRRFLGFTLAGLSGPEHEPGQPVATGLDHLVELGVSAVQLLPVQEFPAAPDRFDWGYFTANFFAPAATFATRADGEARLVELKRLVDALHARGIAVVLDVVFNHSAEGSELGPYINFKGFDAKYYYRQDPGTFTFRAGSGVGNELASERPMVRRFILDCLRFYVERLGIDGFRFDLAALLDLETVRVIAREFPDCYLYGEPWAASGALWSKGAVNAIEPWAVFDDAFRDAVKGSPEGADRGFVQGGGSLEQVQAAVTGNSLRIGGLAPWAAAPGDGVRYLDAHDNLTLADKLEVSLPGMSTAEKEARTKLALALLLTSPGPVMLHAGVEFLRSKPFLPGAEGRGRPIRDADGEQVFDANSYASPDAANNLDWRLKAEHHALFRYVAGLVHLRRGPLGRPVRVAGPLAASYFAWHIDPDLPQALGYTLNDDRSQHGGRRLRVLLNSDRERFARFAVSFPAADGWRLVADSARIDPVAGLEPAACADADADVVDVEPLGLRIYADGFGG